MNDKVLIINTELAQIIGLNESIVLTQLHYWININKKTRKNHFEKKYWAYSPLSKWHENNFPFWSIGTVRNIFNKLEKDKIIQSKQFLKKANDRTKFYTINYNYLHIKYKFKFNKEKPKSLRNVDINDVSKFSTSNCQNLADDVPKFSTSLKENKKEINNIYNTCLTDCNNIYIKQNQENESQAGSYNKPTINLSDFSREDQYEAQAIINLINNVFEEEQSIHYINKREMPIKQVLRRYSKLTSSEVQYVIDVLKESDNIAYPVQFKKTLLYNANWRMHDFYNKKYLEKIENKQKSDVVFDADYIDATLKQLTDKNK